MTPARTSAPNRAATPAGTSTPAGTRPGAAARLLGEAGVLILLLSAFLPIVDFFIVNVALPTIDSTLHASAPTLELVVAGYGTVYAALLVLGGRIGDTFGRRRVLTIGLAGFTLTSLLCGLAPTIWTLVAARLLQGASAALIVPQVLATFQAALDGQPRARAIGRYGATAGLATIVGQLAGGLLVTADIAGSTWQPIFLVNVPLGILAIVLVARFVPDTRSPRPARLDLVGTVLLAATLAAVLVPLAEGRTLGWPVWTWIVLALAPVLAVTAAVAARRTEARGELPLLPPSLLALRSMRRGLAFGLPFFLGFGTFMFVFALTVQDGLHKSALTGGLVIAPLAVAFFAGSLLTPRAIERFGRGTLVIGGVLQVAGLLWLVSVVAGPWPHVDLLQTVGPLAVAGFGQALVFGALFRTILADVPHHLAGIGGGVLITLQQSGLALGVATLGTLYLTLAETNVGTAFGVVVTIQAGLTLLLALGSRTLPHLGRAAAPELVLE